MATMTGHRSSDSAARAFQPTADPAFFWQVGQHGHALTTLRAGILGRDRLLVLAGETGTGKTLVSRALAARVSEGAVVVGQVLYPDLDGLDFLRAVAHAFALPATFATREAFAGDFDRLLADAGARASRVLLIVDEAQSITSEALGEVRRLIGRPGADGAAALAVLLVGQPGLLAKLGAARVEADVACHLRALTCEEMEAYIAHRLRVTGTASSLFTSAALDRMWTISGGIPRLVNLLCHRSLTMVGDEGARIVRSATVDECAGDLDAGGAQEGPVTREAGRLRVRVAAAPRRRRRLTIVAGVVAAALAGAVIGSRVPPAESPAPRAVPSRDALAAYRQARRAEIMETPVPVAPGGGRAPAAADPLAPEPSPPVELPPRERPSHDVPPASSALPRRAASDGADADALVDRLLKEYAPRAGKSAE